MKTITNGSYIKVVEWSAEDGCFIGSAPPLVGPCCHGDNETEVYQQLCDIVQGWVELHHREGAQLPQVSAGKKYSGKFVLRVGSEMHQLLAIRAMQQGISLNHYCSNLLKQTAVSGITPRLPQTAPGVRSDPTHLAEVV